MTTPRKPSPRIQGAPPKPWELQDGEPLVAFQHFCFYRDMQRRSVRVCAKAFNHTSPRKMEKLSTLYKWGERVRAWDVELDRRIRDSQVAEIVDMRKRHVALAVGMQTAVAKDLHALVAKIEDAAAKAKNKGLKYHEPILLPSDLIKLSQHGTLLERLSRGEPTEHTQVDGADKQDLTALTVAELKALKAIKDKLNSGD